MCRHEIGIAAVVPPNFLAGPVKVDQRQRDDRVRRARGGICDLCRLTARVRGIGDVPALHRGIVDSGHKEPLAVWRPPVPAGAVHLLLRNELGETPRDCRSIWFGEWTVG
jgi:hypothetical protein